MSNNVSLTGISTFSQTILSFALTLVGKTDKMAIEAAPNAACVEAVENLFERSIGDIGEVSVSGPDWDCRRADLILGITGRRACPKASIVKIVRQLLILFLPIE